jgi:hypothetical protein
MNGGSITASLDRIEAALERLEAAARDAEAQAKARAAEPQGESAVTLGVATPSELATPGTVDEAQHADLERRHLQLRTAVTASLARLDALIARDDA